MRIIFSTFMALFAVAAVAAQTTDLSSLSKTPGGKRVVDYFAAFNSGDDERLRSFFNENLTADSLKQRPAEPRVAFQKQVRDNVKRLEIKQILAASDKEIKLLAQSAGGGSWMSYTFVFEEQSPQKLIGLRLEPVDPPQPETASALAAPTNKAEFLSAAEKFLDEQTRADKFSGVVLIAQGDEPLFLKAYGLADVEKNIPNRTDTKFNVGSINKLFTQIAIGQLARQGKISYDDRLAKFLPDYPNREAAEKITVRQLVTMKSGVGDVFNDKYWAMKRTSLRKNNDYIPLFSGEPLAFEPGTNKQYSNGGYILLGAIIEKVTGQSYYDYVRENIFKIAGMDNTDSYELDKLPPNTAVGYTLQNAKNGRAKNDFAMPSRGSAAGGGYSNVQDFLKLSSALRSGKLTVPDENGQPRKEVATGIAGGAEGVNALFTVNGQTGYTLVVLSNYDPPSAEGVGKQLRDWLKQIK